MSLLDLMKLSDALDDDGVIPEEELDEREENLTDKEKYMDYYDDVKQPCRYIKEDWQFIQTDFKILSIKH